MAFTDVLMQNVGVDDSTFTFVDSDNSSSQVKLLVNGSTSGNIDITLPSSTGTLVTSATAVTNPLTTDTFTVTSANTTDPLFIIKNTTNDANGARLQLVKDKGAAGAANDVNGLIQFIGDDANQDQVMFSEIKSQVKVHTDGQEGGKFTVSVAEHDGTSTAGLVIEDGDADGELDVTIAAGTASHTTIAGDLTFGTHTRFYSLTGDTAATTADTQIWTIDLGTTEAVYQVKAFFAGSDPTANKAASYELTGLFRHDGTTTMTQLGSAGGAKAGLGDLTDICTLTNAKVNVTGDDIQITVTPGATNAIDWRGYVTVITSTA